MERLFIIVPRPKMWKMWKMWTTSIHNLTCKRGMYESLNS